jgi:hypothetical protein
MHIEEKKEHEATLSFLLYFFVPNIKNNTQQRQACLTNNTIRLPNDGAY